MSPLREKVEGNTKEMKEKHPKVDQEKQFKPDWTDDFLFYFAWPYQYHTKPTCLICTLSAKQALVCSIAFFRALLKEMSMQHKDLLLHNEVRWLSKGLMLERVRDLHHELASFLSSLQSQKAQEFQQSRRWTFYIQPVAKCLWLCVCLWVPALGWGNA